MARIALITGGNRGLGRAAAHALADDGADIILTYRSNPAEAKAVVAEVEERGPGRTRPAPRYDRPRDVPGLRRRAAQPAAGAVGRGSSSTS